MLQFSVLESMHYHLLGRSSVSFASTTCSYNTKTSAYRSCNAHVNAFNTPVAVFASCLTNAEGAEISTFSKQSVPLAHLVLLGATCSRSQYELSTYTSRIVWRVQSVHACFSLWRVIHHYWNHLLEVSQLTSLNAQSTAVAPKHLRRARNSPKRQSEHFALGENQSSSCDICDRFECE